MVARLSALVLGALIGALGCGVLAQRAGDVLYTAWGDLCSVSSNGGEPRCLKTGREYDSPVWQPTGERIVAETGEHDGAHWLVLLDAHGREVRRLTDSSDYIRPIWSPDGRFIFAINYGLGSAIGRWDADGRNKSILRVTGGIESGRQFQMISFSPSGNRAALLTMSLREMAVATVKDNGLQVVAMVPQGFSYVSQSAWRDEDHLLFVGKRDTTRGELWEITIPTVTVTRRGIEGLWLRDQLAIAPDRQSVVVTAVPESKQTEWNIWRYSLATQQKSRITTGTEDIVASWR